MCEVCAVFGVGRHWTDAGDPVGHTVAQGILENREERARRLALINRILGRYKLQAGDWDGESYYVEDALGRRQVAADLSSLWRTAEHLGNALIDPLQPDFIESSPSWFASSLPSN